jgi:hypothetical protein
MTATWLDRSVIPVSGCYFVTTGRLRPVNGRRAAERRLPVRSEPSFGYSEAGQGPDEADTRIHRHLFAIEWGRAKEFESEVKALELEETEEVMENVTNWMKDGIKQGRKEGSEKAA